MKSVTPVTLAVGRLRLVTRPTFIGSSPITKTTGIVVGCLLRRQRCRQRVGNDHHRSATDEVDGKAGQPLEMTFRPLVLERQILALDKTGFGQPLPQWDLK